MIKAPVPATRAIRRARQRALAVIIGGMVLSRIGSAIARFALVWWLTDLTGSAAVLASASAIAIIPQIVLGPLAGAYVDRWNRRWTMIISDGVIALLSLWLAWLFWRGQLQIWHVYAITLGRSLGDVFHWPATQAAVTMLVPREDLPRAHGLYQTVFGGIEIVGPPLGALALAQLPLDGVMFIDVLTAAIAIGALVLISVPEPERSARTGAGTIWHDMREGFRYMRSMPGVMIVMLMAVVMNLVGAPVWTLLPLYVRDVFGQGPAGLSLVQAAEGAGLITGGAALSLWGHRARSRVLQSLGGFLVGGAAIVAMAAIPASALWALALAWLIFGIFNAVGNGTIMGLLQGAIAPEMQGRVNSAIGSLVQLAAPAGLLVSAPAVERLGLRAWFAMAGIVSIVGPLWALSLGSVRAMDTIGAAPPAQVDEPQG
ncbi:MAG: MFS transporter [Anaerolineae bacterium]|jgi:DHA3 family macrolide efflux protein-like MFS transporter|nr:MFS transporter [Chloroflexota bacterium]